MNCPDWNNNYEYESVKDLKKKNDLQTHKNVATS